MVDGGRGQLNVVLQALTEMGLAKIPVVGLAKATEQGGRPIRDRLFLPGRVNPLLPPANAPGWLLLLRLRDETHRFAITYHRKRARKELLASALDDAPGIGPTRKRRLLTHFADLDRHQGRPGGGPRSPARLQPQSGGRLESLAGRGRAGNP